MWVEKKRNVKFHGLSTPDDLVKTWRELKHDDDDKDLNVVFDYVKPEQLKDGFNVINIKYDVEKPNETGHYVLVTNLKGYKEFFDPIAENTVNELRKIKEISEYLSGDDDLEVSLEGEQEFGNSDCGYHCLTHALNLYSEKGGKLPENPTKQDILMDMLKLERAIYYQLKTLTERQLNGKMVSLLKQYELKLKNERMKEKVKENAMKENKAMKGKGEGVSDDVDRDKLKIISFDELKDYMAGME